MWAGILNEILEVHRPTKVKDEFGQEKTVDTVVGKYRCGVSHQSTSRTVINSEITYPYQKRFIVRIYADVVETDEIKYNNKMYLIESIEENRELQNKLIIVSLKPV